MTFTVTYRGADGAVREERVEAANRGECFARCRARGIAPMSVKEGDFVSRRGAETRRGKDGGSPRRDTSGRRDRKDMGRQVPKRMVACVLSVALVALIGIGAWWWIARDEARQSQASERPKAATPPQAPKSSASPAKNPTSAKKGHASEVSRGGNRAEEPQPRIADMSSAVTNDPDRDVVSDLRVDISKAKPMFGNPVQAELANYIHPGRDVPPPDRVSDEDALKAADTPIKYGFDDPVDVLEQKKAVEDLLVEMKEYIQQGGHANDFFEKLQQRQELEGEAVAQVRNNVNELIDKGDTDGAQLALDEYNKYLQAKGIPPVRIKRLSRIKALNGSTSESK